MYVFEITDATAERLARLEALRAELDRRGPLPRIWIGRTRRDLEAEATAASNRLEGIAVTADEARRILAGERPVQVSEQDAALIAGYRDAMRLVLSRADDENFIWQRELLLAVHRAVLGGSYAAEAGRLRSIQNRLCDASTGDHVYLPPPAADVARLVDELCEWLQNADSPTAVTAALAHIRFAGIHPFRDGNGRTARIIASLAMYRGGFRAPQFTSLEEWWGRHPQDYYAAFACLGDGFDDTRDVTGFVEAHVAAQLTQAEALSLRNSVERALWIVLTDIAVSELDLNERAVNALYDALFGRTVTNRYYRGVADISDVTAVHDLKRMAASGLLASRGAGRSAHYVGTDVLLTTVADAVGIDPQLVVAGGETLCQRADVLIGRLAEFMQADRVMEGSVPSCEGT